MLLLFPIFRGMCVLFAEVAEVSSGLSLCYKGVKRLFRETGTVETGSAQGC